MSKKKKQSSSTRNLVAKHARTFNKSQIMMDRKRESKKTGSYLPDSFLPLYQ